MKSIGLYVNPDREGAVQAAKHAASILFDLGKTKDGTVIMEDVANV